MVGEPLKPTPPLTHSRAADASSGMVRALTEADIRRLDIRLHKRFRGWLGSIDDHRVEEWIADGIEHAEHVVWRMLTNGEVRKSTSALAYTIAFRRVLYWSRLDEQRTFRWLGEPTGDKTKRRRYRSKSDLWREVLDLCSLRFWELTKRYWSAAEAPRWVRRIRCGPPRGSLARFVRRWDESCPLGIALTNGQMATIALLCGFEPRITCLDPCMPPSDVVSRMTSAVRSVRRRR